MKERFFLVIRKKEVKMEENTGMTDRQFKIYNKLIVFALKLIAIMPEEQREKMQEELQGIMRGV